MSLLVSAKNITKNVGDRDLFKDLSFGIFDGEKVGLIGPNGSGKSSLLRQLALVDAPDKGEVVHRSSLNFSYVPQEQVFNDEDTAMEYLRGFLIHEKNMEQTEAEVAASVALSVCGFIDFDQKIEALSGGWRKRLSIAQAISTDPEFLILDEPTNHMDWDGILWLEDWLANYRKAMILVSHDRKFLDGATNRIIEINPVFQDGYLSFPCNYSEFLNKKDEYIRSQLSLQESLSNKARRELDWLRAGVKARTTKSRSRMDAAHALINEVGELKSRNLSGTKKTRLEIDSSGIQAKKMLALKNLSIQFGDKVLLKDLSLELGAKTCFALLGENGSGKTSLLKAISGQSDHFTGELFRRDDLKIVYFDQKRQAINRQETLVSYLGDGSDHVVFKDKSIHVASYASRFLFPASKLNVKIEKLSGGEQARLMIAKLLLQPADVLILDEPTNDLDIDTIELLEEAVSGFTGLVFLVSHDRAFLSSLADKFLALDGKGGHVFYADVEQWLKARGQTEETKTQPKEKKERVRNRKIKLSFKEKRQLETIETDVLEAEELLDSCKQKVEDPEVLKDHLKLSTAMEELNQQQAKVDELYSLWNELEEKKQAVENQ